MVSTSATILTTTQAKKPPIILLIGVFTWSLLQHLWGLAAQSGFHDPSLMGQGAFSIVFLLNIAMLMLDATALWFFFQPRPSGYLVALSKLAITATLIILIAVLSQGADSGLSVLGFLERAFNPAQRATLQSIPYLNFVLVAVQLMWTMFLALLLFGNKEYFLPESADSASAVARSLKQSRVAAGTPFDRVLRQAAEEHAREAPFLHRVLKPWVDRLTDSSSALMKGVDIDAVRVRLMRAGFPMGIRAKNFVLLKYVMLLVGALLFMAALPPLLKIIGIPMGAFTLLLSALIGCFYGYKMPDIWLNMKTKQRQLEIQLALPDVMDLLTVSVEAGLGLYAGMQRIASRFKTPLSEEISRSLQEVRLGRTHAEAMRDMAQRVEVEDLSSFITALVQAETMGIPIANVLRAQSDRLREKRAQRAREQAQKAPIKIIVPLVIFIFPPLFVVILGPAMLRIMASGL